jgi:ABC-type phosphate transport system permease subunit
LIWGTDLFNHIDWLESVLGYTGYFLMLFAVPVTSAAYTFVAGSLFFLGFVIFVLSLIISMVCYLTIKEKKPN